MKKLVRDLKRAKSAMGDGIKTPYPEEKEPIRKMSKMIVAAYDLPAGYKIQFGDLDYKSPGDGLEPYHFDELIGKKLTVDVKKDAPILMDMLGE